MAELWTFSTFLREKYDDNINFKECCQAIANKYLQYEKAELDAQNTHEENLILKIEISQLQSLCRIVSENNDSQAELDSLLKQYYQEHLKAVFNIGECEIEKIYSYDEIKIELETRDTINMYQQLYKRKIEMAKKMDDRNIVKKYRQKEQDFLNIQEERLLLEKNVSELKQKTKEKKEREQKLNKLIVQLATGALDLDIIFANLYPEKAKSQSKILSQRMLSELIEKPKSLEIIPHKGGLSSRLLMDFQRFQMPTNPALSRIRKMEQKNGFNRLLQQAETIRKSMKTSPKKLCNTHSSNTNLSSILKLPRLKPSPKPTEISTKSVSFEDDLQQKEINNSLTLGEASHISLDSTISGIPATTDSSSKQDVKMQPKKAGIEIVEDVIIKPAEAAPRVKLLEKPAQVQEVKQKIRTKRKVKDLSTSADSPPTKKPCQAEQMEPEPNKSKNFMDMFLECSEDIPEVSSPAFETLNDDTEIEIKKKPPKEKVNIQKTTKQAKPKFDDFENFFSGVAGKDRDSDGRDSEQPGDMSFDFFDGNTIAEDGDIELGSDNFSFKF